jgi:hypothetical protein
MQKPYPNINNNVPLALKYNSRGKSPAVKRLCWLGKLDNPLGDQPLPTSYGQTLKSRQISPNPLSSLSVSPCTTTTPPPHPPHRAAPLPAIAYSLTLIRAPKTHGAISRTSMRVDLTFGPRRSAARLQQSDQALCTRAEASHAHARVHHRQEFDERRRVSRLYN